MQRFLTYLSLLLIACSAQAGLFKSQPKFLSSEQAFAFSHKQSGNLLELNWQIADGYYLYKKEIEITGIHTELAEPQFPASERYHDEFFGDVEIFRHQLAIQVPFQKHVGKVEIRYQGCTQGFCYPPETVILDLAKQAVDNTQNFAKNTENTTALTNAPIAKQDQLAQNLSQSRLSVFWFFVLGIGLAFTPCVLPMLPLLSAIVIGNQNRPNTAKALLLSITYVQGMALTYTLLGLIVAAIGLPFQIALQSPPVLIGLSILFTILALSMFGLFEIRLPNSWQQKLNTLSQQQQGGSFISVFIMGMIAGLVASPCTSAPLSGALLYVAQSGDLITGGGALYLLALGMGIPLILITLFGNRILPKSGDWLLNVKTIFGFVMLALPVFLLARIFPEWESYLWSALAIAFIAWAYEKVGSAKLYQKSLKLLLIIALALCAKPFADLVWGDTNQTTQTPIHFSRVTTLAELQQKLTASQGKKVMLDLYADWCVACKEFEKYTFPNPEVKVKLSEMLVLQVDMTKNSPANDELMKHFNVLGLPTILFFDEQGTEISQARVTGFMSAEAFLAWLNQL
ncbi:Thiol:disulfide interchange protein DsbD [Bibersteinia trehalosi USDA-ARS-USMARC-190]|uniref:Thiol:disulfide interchange protein DsbD n=1 Tax=Bibersteinia trehalosi USDA-ARS-USMARC-190 TaxID=1263832 RepID=W0R7U3_BIBTR|nr:protein-disulfide reductase DsbD [Bibersteinia trehalosi]AHG86841.1 Thiol:disulfide interchange protein DsbD [Bibersteinia trehalosi USDA-ARS-USMARC-190]